jgi:hypothetical protein
VATRKELYAKFGITAEAAQLFETELGTLLLCARGLENGWHVVPDGASGRDLLRNIDKSTLGGLLSKLKQHVEFDDHLSARFASALSARNRLNHGFYERHNFKIQTDGGRDKMMADLEALHDELFGAWQLVSAMTSLASDIVMSERYLPSDPLGAP